MAIFLGDGYLFIQYWKKKVVVHHQKQLEGPIGKGPSLSNIFLLLQKLDKSNHDS